MAANEIERRLWRHVDFSWLKSALDSALDGVVVEADERVVYANIRYAQLLGYRHPEELIGRPIAELIAVEDAARLARFGHGRCRGENVPSIYDFAARHRSGAAIRLRASVSIAAIENHRCITTIVQPFYPGSTPAPRAALDGPHERLSQREREVMDLILAGRRIKEIALELKLSEKTIATHRARLLKRLGLPGNRELFQYALRHALVDWT